MRNISDVINITDIGQARASKHESRPIDLLSARLVDSIFVKMSILCREYGSYFDDTQKENAEKLQWAMAFSKRNIKRKSQIQSGLDMLEEHKYPKPPQLGQFLDWCKSLPNNHGFPNVHDAFRIALRINVLYSKYIHQHVPTHTVIRHVIDQIGTMKFRSMKEKEAIRIFEHYYTVACRQYLDDKIQDIAIAITEKKEPHPVDKAKSDEARLRAMAEIKGILK